MLKDKKFTSIKEKNN